MHRGTRPAGRRGSGSWKIHALAQEIGVSRRTLDNYRSGETLPSDAARLVASLFAEDARLHTARVEFIEAFDEARGVTPSPETKGARFSGVPARAPNFIGRETELEAVRALLQGGTPVAVVQSITRAAILGLGGIGKTSLAVEYANRFRTAYDGIW